MSSDNRKSGKIPDNVVHSDESGYNASLLPYSTNVGAPSIRIDDIVSWKSRGISNVNKEFENKFNELREQYENMMRAVSYTHLTLPTIYSV